MVQYITDFIPHDVKILTSRRRENALKRVGKLTLLLQSGGRPCRELPFYTLFSCLFALACGSVIYRVCPCVSAVASQR